MVIGPAPATKRAESVPQTRTLAYQEKVRAAEEAKQAAPQAAAPEASAPAPASAQGRQAGPTAGAEASPPSPQQGTTEMAALPPGEDEASDPNALPWQHGSPPNQAPGIDAEAPMPPPPGAYDNPQDPSAALPEDADPNAWPGGSEDEPQEWVQVLVSGVGMHGTASEDAPMLFAFPYGRVLRVVSRYENWVEVIDPQSAATGWMQAQYLAPVPPPGAQQEAVIYQDEEPRSRKRWWRRMFGGR